MMPRAASALTPPTPSTSSWRMRGALVAAVQPAGQFAVFRAVAVDVAIEQIQVHPADAHQPHLGQQLAGAGVDLAR